LHRVLLVQLVLVIAAFPRDSVWRDVLLYAGLLLFAMHLEFRHVVVRYFLDQRRAPPVKDVRLPGPDAPGATLREPRTYN
jgi:hypothetical protein